MAKAVFQKGERVFVKPLGTWAQVENILPHWVKGVEEPLRVHYDVGLGRDFQAHDLVGENKIDSTENSLDKENWRILRARNRVTLDSIARKGPFPGTYPVVVTETKDWGGWRAPAAEYEHNPARIEHQARVIASALRLLRVATDLSRHVGDLGEGASEDLKALAKQADDILAFVYDDGSAVTRTRKADPDVSPALR